MSSMTRWSVPLLAIAEMSECRKTSAKSVDLFLAGPAPLALVLGHRMNAVAPARCYEWVQAGQYTSSCELGRM